MLVDRAWAKWGERAGAGLLVLSSGSNHHKVWGRPTSQVQSHQSILPGKYLPVGVLSISFICMACNLLCESYSEGCVVATCPLAGILIPLVIAIKNRKFKDRKDIVKIERDN